MKRHQKWSLRDIVKLSVHKSSGEDWYRLEIKEREEEKEQWSIADRLVALAPIVCAVLVMLLLMWLSY
jgi:hypothetical protein